MPALTEADAKRLTLQLKLLFSSIDNQIQKVKELIGQAKSGHAHVALGYKSWTAYCETEFAGALPVLQRPRRLELVSTLTELGMSSRAIAPIVGVSNKTVHQDRQVLPQVTPAPSVIGVDIVDAELIDDKPPPAAPPKPITGMDGKSYSTRNVPKPERAAVATKRMKVIQDMASRGMTSGQIGDKLGLADTYIRILARRAGMEIPADRVLAGSHRRIDSNRIVEQTVLSLETTQTCLRLINFEELDPAQAQHWADSLKDSMPALNGFVKQINRLAKQVSPLAAAAEIAGAS